MVAFEPKNLLKISTLAACLTRVNGVAEFCSSRMFPPQNHHCVYWGRCILGRQMFGRIDAIKMFSMVQLGWPHFPKMFIWSALQHYVSLHFRQLLWMLLHVKKLSQKSIGRIPQNKLSQHPNISFQPSPCSIFHTK